MKKRKEKLELCLKKLGLTLLYALELKLSYKSSDVLFSNEIKEYNQIISDYTNVLQVNNIEDPVDIFNCFNQTLWGGYFSADQNFSYNMHRKIFFDYYGLGCVNGDSVCLNNADMLTDVFRSYGYNATTVSCYVGDDFSTDISDIKIKRYFTKSKYDDFYEFLIKIGKIPTYFTGNHAITAVEYNGYVYYFDPTNLCYLNKIDFNKVEVINGTGEFTLKYLYSGILDDLYIDALVGKDIDYSNQLSEKVYLDEEELKAFYNKNKEVYKDIKANTRHKPALLFVVVNFVLLSNLHKRIFICIGDVQDKENNELYFKKLENEINGLHKELKKIGM